jgi:hypothetical protein
LLARRLVERGVRFVQVYSGGNQDPSAWDAHNDLKGNHTRQAAQTDQPIAALLADLPSAACSSGRWSSGGQRVSRLPTHQSGIGRDHNPFGFTMWLAWGGVRSDITYGASDKFGYHAAEDKVHVHDLHAPVLLQLGLDHERLTYRHNGRDFRLSDVHGNVIRPILG